MLGLQYFSFEAVWNPLFIFFSIAVIIGYFYVVGPWREKHFPNEKPVSLYRKLLFITAVVLYYITNGGPSNLLGHLMFSFHMINMSISYLIVPPLLLASIPSFLWKKVFSAPVWKRFKLIMHPIVTLVLFNMIFSIYHIPMVHDFVMTNFTIHRLYYFILLIAALMMWWHVVSPVREWNSLTHVKKMAYIFANGVLLTPACALIIFSPEPLYAIYNDPEVWVRAMGYCVPGDTSFLLTEYQGPQFFNLLPSIEDQQSGGIIMKLVQEVTYGIMLAHVFKDWFKREHSDDAVEAQEMVEKMALNRK